MTGLRRNYECQIENLQSKPAKEYQKLEIELSLKEKKLHHVNEGLGEENMKLKLTISGLKQKFEELEKTQEDDSKFEILNKKVQTLTKQLQTQGKDSDRRLLELKKTFEQENKPLLEEKEKLLQRNKDLERKLAQYSNYREIISENAKLKEEKVRLENVLQAKESIKDHVNKPLLVGTTTKENVRAFSLRN